MKSFPTNLCESSSLRPKYKVFYPYKLYKQSKIENVQNKYLASYLTLSIRPVVVVLLFVGFE